VDITDPAGSARDWAAARTISHHFSSKFRPSYYSPRSASAEDFGHVVIDGVPPIFNLARSAIIAADLVVVPIQPSPYDIWAADEIDQADSGSFSHLRNLNLYL